MRFPDAKALLLPREGVHCQWQLEPETTDPETVEIDLERSESPSGPWTCLQTLDPMTQFSFTDRTAPWRPKNMAILYRLVGRTRSQGQVVAVSPPFGFQGQLPLDAVEIIRQHNILLRGVNGHVSQTGIKATVYKRRTFGPRCPDCTDAVTKRIVVGQCGSCGGTGFRDRGYYNPIVVYMTFSPHPRVLQLANLGKIEDNETTAFLTNFPLLYAGDMVVEPNEAHWHVKQVDVTERKRTIVHQVIRLRQLDHGDVEYQLLRHVDNQEPEHVHCL